MQIKELTIAGEKIYYPETKSEKYIKEKILEMILKNGGYTYENFDIKMKYINKY